MKAIPTLIMFALGVLMGAMLAIGRASNQLGEIRSLQIRANATALATYYACDSLRPHRVRRPMDGGAP